MNENVIAVHCILSQEHKGPVTAARYNWNNSYIASGSEAGHVILHNTVTGQSSSPLLAPHVQVGVGVCVHCAYVFLHLCRQAKSCHRKLTCQFSSPLLDLHVQVNVSGGCMCVCLSKLAKPCCRKLTCQFSLLSAKSPYTGTFVFNGCV